DHEAAVGQGRRAGGHHAAAVDHDLRVHVVEAECGAGAGGGGEGQRTVVHDRDGLRDVDADVGGDGHRRPRHDREVARDDVAQFGGRRRADQVQRQRLPARHAAGQDVDVLESQVVAAGAGQVLHVGSGNGERAVEAVADEVAGGEDGAVVQGDGVEV